MVCRALKLPLNIVLIFAWFNGVYRKLKESPMITAIQGSENVNPNRNEPSPKDSILRASKLLLYRKLAALEARVKAQAEVIEERSTLVTFLTHYQQILNSTEAVDQKSGKLDVTKHGNYQKLLEEADSLKQLALQKREQAAALPDSKEKELLLQQANEIDDTVNATVFCLSKIVFSKEERAQLSDSFQHQHRLVKDQQSIDASRVQQHVSERNEMIPVIRDIMNRMYEAVKKTLASAAAR